MHAVDRPPAVPIVALVTSSGGLEALSAVLGELPAEFPAAVLVLQHLEAGRASRLSQILASRTELAVEEAREGTEVRAGTVYVGPSGHHLLLRPGGTLALTDTPRVHFSRPSADVLLNSLAAVGNPLVAVVLTGRGRDGAAGSLRVHEGGGTVLAQDEATSRHYGMPGAAVLSGGVEESLPLTEIGPRLVALVHTLQPRAR